MSGEDDRDQSKLIDRLTATSLRLRNLFYVNLLLAAAIIFLVFQDPAFVSEKIGPAASTLQSVVKVERQLKSNQTASYNYELELMGAVALIEATSRALREAFEALDALPEFESRPIYAELERQLTRQQRDLVDELVAFDGYDSVRRQLLEYFELDLEATDYERLATFGAFLVYSDYLTAAFEQGRKLVFIVDGVLPGELPNREKLLDRDFKRIALQHFSEAVVYDTVLLNHLRDLSAPDDFFRAVMTIETFCRANGLGNCSLAEIRSWQEERIEAASSKVSAPGIEVNVARDLIVPVSPLILLVAFHIYAMQFRRRQILRRRLLHSFTPVELNLLDEPWVLNSLVLNVAAAEWWWRKVQSGLMTIFLFTAQAAPLAAVAVAGYYTFKQVLLGAFIADEFASTLAALTEVLTSIGVEDLPDPPAPPGLFWEYLWIAVAAFCALVLVIGLCQMISDQVAEIVEAWRHKGEI
ncbi:MAG: hypothetical protein ACFCUT_14505 [Kiloniellaceae bacterium]